MWMVLKMNENKRCPILFSQSGARRGMARRDEGQTLGGLRAGGDLRVWWAHARTQVAVGLIGVVALAVACAHPHARTPELPRFATDAELEQAIVRPVGPDPAMPAFPIGEIVGLSADGAWAIGETPEGIPALWSTLDPSRAARAPLQDETTFLDDVIAPARGGWVAWHRSRPQPKTVFFRIDTTRPALLPFATLEGVALARRGVSPDGSLLQANHPLGAEHIILHVDAARGTVRPLAHPSAREAGYFLDVSSTRALRPRRGATGPEHAPVTLTIEGDRLHSRVGAWAPTKAPLLLPEHSAWTLARARHGATGTLTHRTGDHTLSLPAMTGHVLAPGGRWLVTEHTGEQLQVWDLERIARGHAAPEAVLHARFALAPLAAVIADRRLLLVAEYGDGAPRLRRYALDPPAHTRARVGDVVVRWDRLTRAPSGWTTLDAHAELSVTAATLRITATNRGPAPAHHVRADLTAEPVLPSLGPVYFGQLAPGESVTRVVPAAALVAAGPRRLAIEVRGTGVAAPRARIVVLPRWLGKGPAYHAMARRLIDAARDVLSEATGHTLTVALEAKGAHGFGFGAAGSAV